MAMGRFLNPGNELFRELVNSEIYIDKTDILEFLNRQINTRSKYICEPSKTFWKVDDC